MNDRILGYSVIAILVLFLFIPVGYLIWDSSLSGEERTIEFQGVSSLTFLTLQDPVRILGVEVGVVTKIEARHNSAFVQIETKHPIQLYPGYTVQVTSKGIMGDRFLNISPGLKSQVTISPDSLLQGNFAIGPTEALALTANLHRAVELFVHLSDQLKNGTKGKPSLIVQFSSFAGMVDSMSTTLLTLLNVFDTAYTAKIDTIAAFLTNATAQTSNLAATLPAAVAIGKGVLPTAATALLRIDSIVSAIEPLVTAIDEQDSLLYAPSIASLPEKLKELQHLLNEIAADHLVIPTRLW